MRSLKRPLSLIIAVLMLVSVMAIAPVTASAETASGTINEQGQWVPTTYLRTTDNAVIVRAERSSLKQKNIFARFYSSEDITNPSWSDVTGYGNNKTVEFELYNDKNMYSIENYYDNDENKMLGSSWDSNVYNKDGTSDFDDEYIFLHLQYAKGKTWLRCSVFCLDI